MNNCNWTPGPWVAKSNGHYFDIGKDYEHSCKEIPVYPAACIGVPHELEANAHLIAAAPELYAALDAISKGEGLQPGQTIERLLAKARGES